MFRFSLRELIAVALVIMLAGAWFTDHVRLGAARKDLIAAQQRAELARTHCTKLEDHIDSIETQVAEGGLGLVIGWHHHGGPFLGRVLPDGTVTKITNSK